MEPAAACRLQGLEARRRYELSTRKDHGDARAADPSTASDAAERYHHGALRDALIDAAHALIRERGVDGFRMSDACRRAGVSTAAPYRHFKDREHLIADVMIQGFERFAEVMTEVRDAHPKGSVEAIVAMGLAFRRFAKDDPELFHLMWGVTLEMDPKPQDRPECAGSFDILLEAVTPLAEAAAARDGVAADPRGFALALWSGVHGLTSLEIGGRLGVVEGVDPDRLIEWVTRAFVAGAAAPPAALFNGAAARDAQDTPQ